jgi:hypothetical protein
VKLRASWVALSLLAAAQPVPAQVLTPSQYRSELIALERSLRLGESEEAGRKARGLLAAQVDFDGEILPTDATVLQPIAREPAQSQERIPRVLVLIQALEQAAPQAREPTPVDRALLERLRARQQGAAARGGTVGTPAPLSLSTRLESVLESIGRGLVRFFNWLAEWLGKLRPKPAERGSRLASGPLTAVLVAVVVAVFGLIAYRALRRRDLAPPMVASEPVGESARDADPISREATEWERYALELARAGRRREAVRAWYHAILVTLFRRGILHYKQGRTNWEYVSRLDPQAAWRPAFIEMTRHFDREWYGRHSAAADALRDYVGNARAVLGALREAGEKP